MSNINHLAGASQSEFANGRLARAVATTLNTAGNAVITMPLLGGGMTVGPNVASSGGIIVRQITISNPTGTVSSANVSISSTADGLNVIANATVLANVTAAGTYQDLTVNVANAAVSAYNTQALYVNVNTASGNSNTVTITVFGQVVNF